MKCTGVRKRLQAYLDGALAESLQGSIARHMQSCRECSRAAAGLAETRAALLELPDPGDCPDCTAAVLRRIAQFEEQRAAGGLFAWARQIRFSFASAAVCAMLIGFICGFTMSTMLPPLQQAQEFQDDELYLDVFSDLPSFSPGSPFFDVIFEEGDYQS